MKMPRILIISYYFPPVNTVAANRAASWIKYFYQYNLFPVVISRHWNDTDKKWSDLIRDTKKAPEVTVTREYEIHHLPSSKHFLLEIFNGYFFRQETARRVIYFFLTLIGRLNPEVDAYQSFKKYIFHHLKSTSYDLVLVTSPPTNGIRLAHEIYVKFKIPYISDFRDLWNNELLRKDYSPNYKTRARNSILEFWIRRWIKSCSLCLTVSEGLADQVRRLYDGPQEIIHNGYEESLFNKDKITGTPYFLIVLAGTYYLKQNPGLMAAGLQQFLADKDPESVRIKLIGADSFPEFVELIRKHVPDKFLEITGRIKPLEAVNEIQKSHVLLHAGWKGYAGIYTTKMFDFIASGSNILLCPGDEDVLDDLITETATGKIANSSSEFNDILSIWYKEWQISGKVSVNGNENVAKYSRRNQAAKLAGLITSLLNKRNKDKALIVSYYYPPCNGAPSWRPHSWAESFANHGIYPVVITRHWKGSENSWDDYIKDIKDPIKYRNSGTHEVYFLPTSKRWIYSKIARINNNFRFLRRLIFVFINATGNFNIEVDAHSSFKRFLRRHLKNNSYDYIILTSPPPNILRLSSLIKKYSNAFLVFDFRDLWNNNLLKTDYRPSFRAKMQDVFFNYYHHRWIPRASLVTAVAEPFREILYKFTDSPIKIIYNGFEHDLFNQFKKVSAPYFRFTVVGILYSAQDLKILIQGLNYFLIGKTPDMVKLSFIGIDTIPETAQYIRNNIPEQYIYCTPRVSKEEAVQYTRNADVLFYAGWKGMKGIMSTKIFDYIASGNRILLAPGDNDVIEKLLIETGTGKVANSTDEFVGILEEWYQLWLSNDKYLEPKAISDKVSFYSRSNQTKIFAEALQELKNSKKK